MASAVLVTGRAASARSRAASGSDPGTSSVSSAVTRRLARSAGSTTSRTRSASDGPLGAGAAAAGGSSPEARESPAAPAARTRVAATPARRDGRRERRGWGRRKRVRPARRDRGGGAARRRRGCRRRLGAVGRRGQHRRRVPRRRHRHGRRHDRHVARLLAGFGQRRRAAPARAQLVGHDALQPVPRVGGRGGAGGRVLREHRVDPRDDARRQVLAERGQRRRLVVGVAEHQRHRRVDALVRMAPGEQLVGDQAGGVEVGLRGDLAAHDLLGRHVGGRADDVAGRGAQLGHLHLAERLGDPEVGDLGVPVGGQQHVLGLEVAVHDPLRGRLGEPAQHALEHARDVRQRQPPDERPQRPALEVLHRDERHAVVLEVLDHRHDARVVERAGDARLVQEAAGERGVGGVGRVQLLQRDLAVERVLAGEVDGRHATAAELAHDLVAADDTGWIRRRHVPGNARPRALFRER